MEIVMPKMGESVNEGTIIKWHKKKGDSVKRDEIIFEISTDKVDTEIPSPGDGVLSEIKVDEGDTVEVGTVVAILDENGGGSSDKKKDESKKESKDESKKSKDSSENESKSSDEQSKKEKSETKESSSEKESSSGKESSDEDTEEESTEEESGELTEVTMPKMGESVMEGTIIKWFKKVGDQVKKDETLFEISTDKVDTEVPSPEAGTVAEILVGEQETVEVGTVVAKLSSDGKTVKSGKKESGKSDQKKEEKEKKSEEKPKSEPESMHDNFGGGEVLRADEEVREDVGFLSPLVLSIANKEKVSFDELKRIKGTGLHNRITKKDILSYIENRSSKPEEKKETPAEEKKLTTSSKPQMEPVYSSSDVEKIPMDNIRQKIMQHMIASRDTSVHVSAMLEADMTRVHNFLQKKKEEYQQKEGVKLTYMAFIAHAVVKALKEYPLVNATIEGNNIVVKKFVNLGIAVAIEPTGLIVPNIKGAGERNIIGLAKSINDLAYRSRNKKLTPDDISNGTFTITNYGVFGTLFGTPIINQPEVAILGVGAVVKRPVVVEVDGSDTIAVKPILALTLSHDHRLVDGMLGGRFLKSIKDTLESFDESMF